MSIAFEGIYKAEIKREELRKATVTFTDTKTGEKTILRLKSDDVAVNMGSDDWLRMNLSNIPCTEIKMDDIWKDGEYATHNI
jgi:hypothetical protein